MVDKMCPFSNGMKMCDEKCALYENESGLCSFLVIARVQLSDYYEKEHYIKFFDDIEI